MTPGITRIQGLAARLIGDGLGLLHCERPVVKAQPRSHLCRWELRQAKID